MRYEHLHSFRCKVCQSGLSDAIDYQHWFKGLSPAAIANYWSWLNLNIENLYNHFSAKSGEPFREFFTELKRRAKLEALTEDEILDEIRIFYEHGEAHAHDASSADDEI